MECSYVIEQWNGSYWTCLAVVTEESSAAAESKALSMKRDIEERTEDVVRVEPIEALFEHRF